MTTKNKVIIGAGIVLALILSIVGLVGGNQSVSTSVDEESLVNRVVAQVKQILGGASGFEQVAYQDNTTGANEAVIDYHQLAITSGINQAVWTNKTGTDVLVDYGLLTTSGTASTSYKLWLFATTSSSVAATNDFVTIAAPLNTELIRAYTIPTSTVATTTDSNHALKDSNTDGVPMRVRNGQTVVAYLQSSFFGPCNGSVCETATSTNRGFNVLGIFRTIATSSPQI